VWLVLGPALIAGGIGLASAALSFISSQRSLSHTSAAEQASRHHQLDLLVLNRRLDAIEQLWQCLFEIERTRTLSDRIRGEVVRSLVWLPDETGKSVLQAVLKYKSEQPTPASLQRVRELLLTYTKTTED